MKLKHWMYYLGYRPRPREYTFDLDQFTLENEGRIDFARWRHPKEMRKEITQRAVDELRKYLPPDGVAVDIGAHTGDTTIPMALAAGPGGAVFAVEPNRYVFKVLLANAALNRTKTNIFPLMVAATVEDGEYEFQYSDPGFCNGGKHDSATARQHAHFFSLPVTGRNLANLLHRDFPQYVDRIAFVKIDTEGYDRSVANSVKPILEAHHPYLRSEIFKLVGRDEREGYYNDLRELGYRVHKLNDEEDFVGQELARSAMMSWGQFDIFAIHESRG